MLLLSLHQAAEAMVPVAIGLIIDRAVATGDPSALSLSVLGLAVVFTVLSLAWRFGSRQEATAIERETHLLRVRVAGRALDPGHLVGALGWVRALPDGAGAEVGEGGRQLTAAQAQQLALARLALADPQVVPGPRTG